MHSDSMRLGTGQPSDQMNSNPLNALVMCLAEPTRNPRPNRIIRLLADAGLDIDVVSFPFSGTTLPVKQSYFLPHASRRSAPRQLVDMTYKLAARSCNIVGAHPLADKLNDMSLGIHRVLLALATTSYNLVVVEDLQLLPLAFAIKGDSSYTKIVFDAREYYPRQHEQRLRFRLIEQPIRQQMCRDYLPRCDYIVTVSPGLAQAYSDEFGVAARLLRSTPRYWDVPIRKTSPTTIRLVHHGLAKLNRGIANMIDVVRQLDSRFTLDLYLVGNERHISQLRQYAADCSRVQFRAPVAFEDIIPT
jgi:hypothetical protein